jgi:hypothetical protein
MALSDKTLHAKSVSVPAYSVTFTTFDVATALEEDPQLVADLFQNVYKLILDANEIPLEERQLSMPPQYISAEDLPRLDETLKVLESNPYCGINIVTVSDRSMTVPVAARSSAKTLRESISPTESYLLVGGLGGLGRSIARLLVANGAKSLIYLSRSGAEGNEDARAFMEELRLKGAAQQVLRGDICKLDKLTVERLPTIAGVVQCAGVIKVGLA